jgi:peptide/nickel transport system substrate-binding protein
LASSYWDKWWQQKASRRRVLGTGAAAGVGVAGMALVGCGDDDDDGPSGTGTAAPGATTAAPTSAAAKPVAGGTYRYIGGPIGGLLDPHRTNTPYESAVIWHWAGNFLMRFNVKDGLPEPDLAAAQPEIPGDGTLLTFKIRPEAKFQQTAPVNGRNVTAEDVKLTFERIKGLGAKSPRSGNYVNVDSITAIDNLTVQFKLKAPQADLLNVMSDQYEIILPKEISSRGEEAVKVPADIIGSGPYQLVTYEAGKGFEMKKRPDGYWRKDVAFLDGNKYTHQTDNQQKANALRAGEVDATDGPVDIVKTFQNDAKYNILRATSPARDCLLINHTKDRYKDLRIRQALWRAIDRRQVYEKAFGGGGVIGGAMTPAATSWVLPEKDLLQLPGFGDRAKEIAEAKKLLAAAGVPDGFEETITTVTAFSAELINDVLVANLADVGIKLKTENIGNDFSVFLQREIKGEYNLASTIFLSGPYPDAQLVIYHHTTKGSRNYGKYGTPELDAKLDKQSTIYDFKQRQALVFEIQRDIANNPGPGWTGSRIGFGINGAHVQNDTATGFAAGYDTAENVWFKKA